MSIPTRLLHYTMKCKIGIAPNVTICAYRCSECHADFHVDRVPTSLPELRGRISKNRFFSCEEARMSKISDDDVFESLWTQICELEGDGVLVIPNGCGKSRFERILKEVEDAMEREAQDDTNEYDEALS